MRTRIANPLWLVLAIALASLALLSACDSDGEEGARQPTDRSSTPTTTTATPATFDCDADYPGSAADPATFPIEIEDSSGAAVTFERPPSRIVSLSAAHTEIFYAIGAGGQIAAADNFSDCPKAAEALEHLDSFAPSAEAIIALEPDLVLLFFDPGDLRTSLEATGLKVVLFDSPASIRGVYEQIDLLGQISGHVEEAANLVASMQAGIEGIVESLGDRAGPTVFHEGDNTFFSAGPGSFVGDLYDTLRAENIANATGEPFPQLTQEAIIAAAPEVIILADEDAGETAETVKARPGWDSIPAVQNGRIYTIDPNIISRPGPRLVEALETLAGFLYRES